MVLGLRRSPAWVVAAFTKVTPAVVVLWLAARRQWRGLLAFGAAALAVGTVSLSLAPSLWVEWIAFLMSHGNTWALARLAVAAVIVIIASRRGWPWLLPCALIAASPVPALYVLGFVCLLPRVLSREALAWLREPFGGVWATATRALTPSRSRRVSRDMDRRVEAISAMHARNHRVAGASPAPGAAPR